jgi:hypothetical protein
MTVSGFVFVVVGFLVLLILLEGRRQKKKYGKPSGGTSLMRTGMLELQSMLEPEKKIELLQKKEDRTAQEESGDPPRPPGPGEFQDVPPT